MNELIKRAFEVRDDLRYCVGADMDIDCEKCKYHHKGCVNTLMLDAAKVIEKLIEEVDGGEEK